MGAQSSSKYSHKITYHGLGSGRGRHPHANLAHISLREEDEFVRLRRIREFVVVSFKYVILPTQVLFPVVGPDSIS